MDDRADRDTNDGDRAALLLRRRAAARAHRRRPDPGGARRTGRAQRAGHQRSGTRGQPHAAQGHGRAPGGGVAAGGRRPGRVRRRGRRARPACRPSIGGESPADESADPAHPAHRPRRRRRGRLRSAGPGGRSPRHAHRTRRRGQDSPRAPGGQQSAPWLPGWGLVRRAGRAPRPRLGRRGDRPDVRPAGCRRSDVPRAAGRLPRSEASPARPRQLRAPAAGGHPGCRSPRRLPRPHGLGDEPGAAPRLRRARARGAAAGRAGPAASAGGRRPRAVSGRRALPGAGAGGESGVSAHAEQCRGGRDDLRPAGWAPARARIGGRAHQAPPSGGDGGPAGATAAGPDGRRARRAGPPADLARHAGLELRPAASVRTAVVPVPRRLHGRVDPGGGGSGLRSAGDRRGAFPGRRSAVRGRLRPGRVGGARRHQPGAGDRGTGRSAALR